MSKRLLYLAGCCALLAALASVSFAQTTTATTTQTQAVQNADGSWTVIQYPTGKEVVVDFTPSTTYSTAHGRARLVHMADGTKIALDLSGLPADATAMNLYAVDPFGKVTALGPVTISNGRSEEHTSELPL